MKYGKTAAVLALLGMVALMSTACQPQIVEVAPKPASEVDKLRAAFVFTGQISDGAFTTIGYQSSQAMLAEPFIGEVAYIEGVDASTDGAKIIRDYIAEGYDFIWGHSGRLGPAIMEIAPQFPEAVFGALAYPPEDQEFDNVWFSLSHYEGAYYAVGVLGALMTETDVLGFVGGRENPLYTACAMAYEEGAKSVNPDINVLTVFTGSYDDPVKAKEAAVSQIQSGADLIASLQSLGMSGIFAAAEEAENQVWVIGKDNDQFPYAPDVVLTSVVIDYAAQMRNILAEVAAGNRSGSMPQDVATGAVYLADFYGQVPAEVVAEVDAVLEQVKNGEVEYTTQYDLQ